MVANRQVTGGDAGDGSEQTPHVVIGYVDARAGPDSPRHRSAILAPGLVAVTVNLFAGEPEQPDHVGIRAEAAVPYSDRVLGCQPRRHQRVWTYLRRGPAIRQDHEGASAVIKQTDPGHRRGALPDGLDAAACPSGRCSGGNCGPPGVVDTPGTVVDVAAGAADVAVIPAASAVLITLAPT